MSGTSLRLRQRVWTRDGYLISTDPSLIPIAAVNEAFASDFVYWANSLPEDVMRETLNNSLCFGLYERLVPGEDTDTSASAASSDTTTTTAATGATKAPATTANPSLKLIGIARCVTDFTTFVYLTDVYTEPAYQGKGLGTWLMCCVREVMDEMPHLRRTLLFTRDWTRSVPFYERLLGMEVLECGSRKAGDGAGDGAQTWPGVAALSRKGRGHPDFSA